MKIVYVIQNTWYAGGQTRVLVNKANYWVEEVMMFMSLLRTRRLFLPTILLISVSI